MKRSIWTLAALLAISCLASAADPVPGFFTDYDDAKKVAQEKDKPLYLHFTTDWCVWCRRIEKDIYATPAGKEALAAFVPVTLNCTEGAKHAAEYNKMMVSYGGQGYPFIVMTTPDGKVLKTISG